MLHVIFFFVVELVSGGSVINGTYPVLFNQRKHCKNIKLLDLTNVTITAVRSLIYGGVGVIILVCILVNNNSIKFWHIL